MSSHRPADTATPDAADDQAALQEPVRHGGALPPGAVDPGAPSVRERLAAVDWAAVAAALDAHGHATTGVVLTAAECAALSGGFTHPTAFRSRIDMERYRFGAGDYAYYAEPLPPLVQALRTHAYRHLAPIANRWAEALGEPAGYPATFAAYRAQCAAGGQTRPTPLLLRYTEGGYNRLHQDRYGPRMFPLQVACCLSEPGTDYEGGAFLLLEQHPRQQSVGEAVLPTRGELIVFPSAVRPVQGRRGWYRAQVRHGVSRITRGDRFTLGIIFHDAE